MRGSAGLGTAVREDTPDRGGQRELRVLTKYGRKRAGPNAGRRQEN